MTKKPGNPRKKPAATRPPLTLMSDARAASAATANAGAPKGKTKTALLVELLEAPAGASAAIIMAATGWQAHTVRAALSGLRKSGRVLDRETTPEGPVYRIVHADSDVPAASIGHCHLQDDAALGRDPIVEPAVNEGSAALPQNVATNSGTTHTESCI